MRLIIVGGVGGGMSAAARARRISEDAEIIVLERGDYVSYANCGLPYYVSGEIQQQSELLVQTPETLKSSLNIDVRLRHNVTGVDTERREVIVETSAGEIRLKYDALVLSPGAKGFTPPISGIESPRVRTLRTVDDAIALREKALAGASRAVVLGAGFIGLEAAEALEMQGLHTSVVELAPHVLPPLDDEMAWYVTEELKSLGIQLYTGVAAEQILQGTSNDTVILGDGTELEADIIVLAVGVRPDTSPFEAAGITTERGAIVIDEHGRTNIDGIWAVGDATLSTDPVTGMRRPVALAGPANRAGRLIADHIFTPERSRPLPAPLGTAIVRVGNLTAAMTGANRASLEQSDIAYQSFHLHPNQHAGYFPGATQIHLIVHISPQDGRIFGAQAVGQEGVDKRIDVIATAIRAGLSVEDLIDLDLSYSPPYGQAKDAVNLAGMVGSNILHDTLRLWDARDLEQVRSEALILDTRNDVEVETGMLPEALHIPHTELRQRLDEVREAAAGRPVRVMCQSGVRSAIAHRVLVAAGFDSASLSGGMLTLRSILGDAADKILIPNQKVSN